MRIRALPFVVLFFCGAALAAEGLGAAEQAYAQGKYYAAGIQFQILADGGDAQAQFRIAQLYAEGKGVAQNFDTAIAWYRKAAAQGHTGATRVLTELALQGSTLLAPRPHPESPKDTADDDAPPRRIEVTVKERRVDREWVVWPAYPRKHRYPIKPIRGKARSGKHQHGIERVHGKVPRPIRTPMRPYLIAPGTSLR